MNKWTYYRKMVKNMNENIKSANPLGTQKESKLLVKFAIPCIISMLVTALYNIVDQIFIGQGIGINGNAAVSSFMFYGFV